MIKKKLFVTFSAICVAMGVALSGNVDVMAKETQVYVQTDAGVEVQSINEEMDILTSGEESEAVQLATPTNLHWGTNWTMCWDGVPESEGYYGIEIYKDGELYDTHSWAGLKYSPISVNFSQDLEESGVYKFRIQARKDWNDTELINSEWSEFSEERTYVRPDVALPTVEAPVWVENEAGKFQYTTVKGAGGYRVTVYSISNTGEKRQNSRSWWVNSNYEDAGGTVVTRNEEILSEGRYCVTVQALSGDVDKVANGKESELSAIFSTVESAQKVADIISGTLGTKSASEALKDIKDGVSDSVIANAMQTDQDVLDQVAELEALYAEEKGIEVAEPAVSEEASQYVDSSKVNVVGAGLNAEANTIGLEIDVPEKKEYINDQHYKNSVQLDITLVNDGNAIHGDLKMPITITMPIPAGIEAKYLVILHYNAEGVAEKINVRVNADNTVTFTVNSLSTFALAEGSPFSDVKENAWYYPAVMFVYGNDLMAGKGKDNKGNMIFDPNKPIPREEFVQVLYNASGKPAVDIENKFPDVKNAWYKNAVLWANANDIANGKGNGDFGVTESISRQDLALMLYKYARMNGYDLTANTGEIDKYADGQKVSSYAKTAMDWAITKGVMSGKGTKGEDISTFKLDPAGTATRAECAAMLKNFMEAYGE